MKPLTKKELKEKMSISASKLRQLLNVDYIDELIPLGYNANQRILSPKIVCWVLDEWGIEYEELNK